MKSLLLLSLVFSSLLSTNQPLSYNTSSPILNQGENGFYYAWGTPSNYLLMEYGLSSSGNLSWHGLESYQTVSGSSLHPGEAWGSMVIWVAPCSGKVNLNGFMEKGTNQGDGVNLGIYHHSFENKSEEALFSKFVESSSETLKFDYNETISIKKGDSIIFYCDSGMARSNSSDSCGCPFVISYTQMENDLVENEDLSKYLCVGRAGDIGGFTHVDTKFAASNLSGNQKETNKGCKGEMASLFTGLAAFYALLTIKRRKDNEN